MATSNQVKKTYRTNSKEVRAKVIAHILENVRDAEDNDFENFADCAKYMKSEFERVANYPANLQRFPNPQERFSDYLRGIPFGFEFYYSEIEKFMNTLELNGKKSTDEEMEKLYHYLIFSAMEKALKYRGIYL